MTTKTPTRCKAHRAMRGPCACYSLEVAEAALAGVFAERFGPRDGSPVAELLKAPILKELAEEVRSRNRKA
jgi:hypothetical protein